MTQMRWGANAPGDVNSARERLLDAAEACFARYGVMKTTVEDVASQSRVSRATVYRYFDGRDALILGVLLREATRWLHRLDKRMTDQSSFTDAIVESVMFSVESVQRDANLALLFKPEVAGLTENVVGASEALFATTGTFLRPYFEEAQRTGELRAGLDLDEANEWIIRAIISLLTIQGPRPRTAEEQRQFVRTFLVPAFVTEVPAQTPPAARRATKLAKPKTPARKTAG